jgi:hypothetical protein
MFRSKKVLTNVLYCLLLGSLCVSLACSKPQKDQVSTASTQADSNKDKDRDRDRDRDHDGRLKFIPIGVCDDPGNCKQTNTCPASGTCTVIVANNSGVATATIQGQTPNASEQPYVCASAGTQIVWQSAAGAQFIGDFGGSSPWSSVHNYIVGNSTASDTETAGNRVGCYKYRLEVCNMLCSGTPPQPCSLQCGVSPDPIIIIGQDPRHTLK